MVFKKMLSAFGVGGPSVDTVLANPNTRPGLTLDGQVNLLGGEAAANIEQIVVGLVTRVEIEGGDTEYAGIMEFHRQVVSGPMQLAPKQQLSIPFQLPVPWETPITDVYGQRLHGMTMGLRTELAIARAVDKSDLDQVNVHPLPVHERILEAFLQLGFRFKSADLERGRIHGVQQTLPFYQEIEFFAAPQYAQTVNELELTFVTNPHGVDVVLECDKRGGFLTPGHDMFGRYQVSHADAERSDWVQVVDGWLQETIGRFGAMRAQAFGPQGYGVPGHGPQGYGAPNKFGHPQQRRGGVGMGGVVAGAALGAAGGMLAGHMIGNAFEGAEEEVAEAAGDFGGDFGGGDFGGFEEF